MAQSLPKNKPHDRWTANGSVQFGSIPANVLPGVPSLPICLEHGGANYGATHIRQRHLAWLQKAGWDVAEAVWRACQTNGAIYTSEEADKLKIQIVLPPNALLVLRYKPGKSPFFSVITLYSHEGALDGQRVCAFPGSHWKTLPVFDLAPPAPPPTIIYKKARAVGGA